MNLYLICPLVVPFSTAVASLLAWRRRTLQRAFSLTGSAALLGAGGGLLSSVWKEGVQAAQMGGWPAPFGITLAADLFSAMMIILTGLAGLAIGVYSLAGIDSERESFGYYPLLNILLMGVCGSFVAGDIFNLYVWFEVMLIGSFVLLELGGEKAQLEGAVKYVALNVVSSAFFLTAVALLYGAVGTLNMADLAREVRTAAPSGMTAAIAFLFLIAFGIKAAIFPLFFWLPASYHTPPAPVSAVFAGLLTEVGVYAMIRVFTLVFVHDAGTARQILLVAAGLTMAAGILGAVAQNEFRRILSFDIVSQTGYMVMGLGLFTPLALTGSIFMMMHNMIVKPTLFLTSGVCRRLQGTYELKNLGGLFRAFPGLSALFLIPAFSLAGVPPLSGFWSKFLLIKAGLETKNYVIVGVALSVGLLTLLVMTKIWAEAFWKRSPEKNDKGAARAVGSDEPLSWALLLLPIGALAGLTVVIGLAAEPFIRLASTAAEQLMNPSEYIKAVLGGTP